MSFDPDCPYNDLPPLPPSADIELKPILRACIGARAAIAELKIAGQMIPNQAVLINSIPFLEAQASSEIENIVTTTDRLFRLQMKKVTRPTRQRRKRCGTVQRLIEVSIRWQNAPFLL